MIDRKNVETSIIIVHYQVKTRILSCIQSLIDSNPKTRYEIIVVDNDEKPTIGNSLKKQFPECVYIRNNKNVGFGAANNIGASHAKGEYLFFLNPDTLLSSKTIDTLIGVLKNDKKMSVVAPLFLSPQGNLYPLQGTTTLTPLNSLFAFSFLNKIFPNNPISRKYWLHDWNKKTKKEVDVVPGTAFMISKKLFFDIGQFDKKYFLFFEEHDLGIRLRKKGYKLVIDPSARITHYWGESTKQYKNTNSEFLRSRFYYFKKHFGFFWAVFVHGFLSIRKKHLFILFLIIIFLSLTQ